MFNAPRPTPLRFAGASGNGLAASFLSDDPLAASIYSDDGGMDPWSAAPTPPPPPEIPQVFSKVIADAVVPSIYSESLAAVDPTFSGETSLNALHRVISTSGLPATTIDRIISLVSSRPRVSKLEFYVSLALIALAQQGKDLSIEKVASISQQSQTLPSPNLDLSKLSQSTSTIGRSNTLDTNGLANGHTSTSTNPVSPPVPAYSENDPWNTSTSSFRPPNATREAPTESSPAPGRSVGSAVMGGLPQNWWRKQEHVEISIMPEKQGFILNRYVVYVITTKRGPPAHRRYSEFSFLWDCLVRRYPFRILPNLPPKRLGADAGFLEQRRKGLVRFLNFVINHPIMANDGLLNAFLIEPSFESWRKTASSTTGIKLEEESSAKRIDRTEEMSIPSDLEEKMELVRARVGPMVDHWTRICIFAERLARRRESAAADLSRLHITLNAMSEVTRNCWHQSGENGSCDLSNGVGQGVSILSTRFARQSDLLETRSLMLLTDTLEALKAQRDLYIATRDLFSRHHRLAPDKVDLLKKRVESNSLKAEHVRHLQKPGWEQEADKLVGLVERDQIDIAALLARRIFVRHAIWHELRVILHNRENVMLSKVVQTFATHERDFAQLGLENWIGLVEDVEDMPYE